ncbi:MAG: sulfur carrier protein ThiS [Deltaproteobacteria bacterium]|nr:sulfur carrier protein ThiS [Deltaproteobacteria bacterium]
MTIILNGITTEIPCQITIKEMLSLQEIDAKLAIVEINEKIINRNLWQETLLCKGDKVELMSLVGGG